MTEDYTMLRRCADNAARAGMKPQAANFARRARQCQWVPAEIGAHGYTMGAHPFADAARWATKAEAVAVARVLQMPLRMVERVEGRFCTAYGIHDARFGFLSRHWVDGRTPQANGSGSSCRHTLGIRPDVPARCNDAGCSWGWGDDTGAE